MGRLRFFVLVILSATIVAGSSGCANFFQTPVGRVLYDLQPHRLWRLNRMPPPSRDVYFSVPPERVSHMPGPSIGESSDPPGSATSRAAP